VDLPGRQSGSPSSDLYRDAEHVTGLLDGSSEDVLLVGHSYAGAVITEAGEHPAVTGLVYIAGLLLDVGQSCQNAAADDPDVGNISHAGRPDLGASFVIDDQGDVTLEPEGAAACFYSDCDETTTEWALARLGRQPLVALSQPVTRAAWRTKPATYAVCGRDQSLHPDLQRLLARRCTEALEWDTGHSPFLSRPELVVELLAHRAR
jgi:pimeloyl-ACP methyl ester carboxylesterase